MSNNKKAKVIIEFFDNDLGDKQRQLILSYIKPVEIFESALRACEQIQEVGKTVNKIVIIKI